MQANGAPFLFKARHGNGTTDGLCVTLQKRAANWGNATAFNWTDGAAQPVPVQIHSQGDSWKFTVDNATWVFDWTTSTLRRP